ncbi:MAG TPA: c-type cytochrome [Patescibacteria group bacterium]|nr:c-type cytochrome [Patescibacteria group bacterium]
MQIKVVIGTISFMLVMIILGVAALFEPARLEETADAFVGRQIEKGAVIFHDSCAECHGEGGLALDCSTTAGEEIDCKGIPLNHAALLCGDPSLRMQQMAWNSSKENFIKQTISSGRPGTLMPIWSKSFGGPMEDYQIDQVASFVLNWAETPGLCGDGAVAAIEWPDTVEELPDGDAENGRDVFQLNGCAVCHGDPEDVNSVATVGPWLGNIGNDAATRILGMSAEQYIYESVLDPTSFVAPECPNGPCNDPSVMRQDYPNLMSEQDMADLVQFYMTLKTE